MLGCCENVPRLKVALRPEFGDVPLWGGNGLKLSRGTAVVVLCPQMENVKWPRSKGDGTWTKLRGSL